MNLKSKYRFAALSLVVVFCLYTVGLPLIIFACPMMASKGTTAPCCGDMPTKGVKFLPYKDSSCCKVTIAAKPNTSEFISSKIDFKHDLKFERITKTFESLKLTYLQNGFVEFNSSPPLKNVTDIPIFTSSLLI